MPSFMSKVCRTMSPRRTRPIKKELTPMENSLRYNIERCLYHLVKLEEEKERYSHKKMAYNHCVAAQLCLDIIIRKQHLLKSKIDNYEMQIQYMRYLLKKRTSFAEKVRLAKTFKRKVCKK